MSTLAQENAIFPKDRTATASDGTRLAYTVVGDGPLTPIFFVNGWTCSDAYWAEIGERHGLDLTVVESTVDPTWRFMTLDWDGKIRTDCSSPYAMASLIERRSEYQVATGNDADADRHGIVTPDAGLMNPNHYLAVAISYLFRSRTDWPRSGARG